MFLARLRVFSLRWPLARGLGVALIPLLLFAGCTGGRKLSYTDAPARIDASGTARVAATAYDQRKQIISRQESPAFIGNERSHYHWATVSTASGRPLSDDVTNLLATSLAAKGFNVTPVVVSQPESSDAVAQKMATLPVDRSVVIAIADWRTDTRTDNNSKTAVSYHLSLQVLDPRGKVLAERQLAGHENEISGPTRDAFRHKLEQLMNVPEVTRALSVSAAPVTIEPTAPAQPAAPPHPPATSGQPLAPSLAPDVATQLQKLKELYEKGLVTEDVYKEKMREILNKL